MSKKKFYAVKNGRKIGIFETWAECQEQINGYKGAEFKSFPTYDEAKNYISGENIATYTINEPENNEIFVYVDGSFNRQTNEYGYGIVLIEKNKENLSFCGKDNKEDVASMRNVAGELKGTMFAVNYVVKNMPNINKVKVFYDYFGIEKWATGEWKTNLEYTKKYKEFMQKIMQKIEVSFVKVEAHTGNKYNEEADKLAKSALGLLEEKK